MYPSRGLGSESNDSTSMLRVIVTRGGFEGSFSKQEPFDHISKTVAGLIKRADRHPVDALIDAIIINLVEERQGGEFVGKAHLEVVVESYSL